MAPEEDTQIEIPEDSAEAIAALADQQRSWVMEQLEATATSEVLRRADRVRLRVKLLVQITEFLPKLEKARTKQEMDELLGFELRDDLQGVTGIFDLAAFPGYEKIITDAMMHCLQEAATPGIMGRQWRRNALIIHNVLGRNLTFDKAQIPGYEKAWKTVFLEAVKDAFAEAESMLNTVTEINFREIPNYEAVVKEKYYDVLFHGRWGDDKKLRSVVGEGLDYSDQDEKIIAKVGEYLHGPETIHVAMVVQWLERFGDRVEFSADKIDDFEAGVKAAFLCCLKNGHLSVEAAKVVKKHLGAHIDFSDEVRAGIIFNLDRFEGKEDHNFKRAIQIQETLGAEVVLHTDPECRRSIVNFCMRMLATNFWNVDYIAELKERFGENISFSEATVPGYNTTVQATFLTRICEGDVEYAAIIRDDFGQGVPLGAADLDGYAEAVEHCFRDLMNRASVERAKLLTDTFEEGAEIKDKTQIVQGAFLKQLTDKRWRKAIKIKESFEPDIPCDREHIGTKEYDEAFCACLDFRIERCCSAREMGSATKLYESLGAGVDISKVLRRTIEDDPGKFIAFANRQHWKTLFGDELIDRLLNVLPKRTDEKRNAFTHNSYDRTSQFLAFGFRTGLFYPDKEGIEIVTDYIQMFGLARAQNLYLCFHDLRKNRLGKPAPGRAASEGITSLADLENRIKELRGRVYGDEPILELGDLGPIEVELLSLVTGKSTHRFDDGRPMIGSIIDDFGYAVEQGEIEPTPEGYQVETIEVAETTIEFDPEEVRADYQVLKKEIIDSVEKPEEVLPLVITSLRIIDRKLATLRGIDDEGKTGKRRALDAQIEKAEELQTQLREVKNLDALMGVMLTTKFMGANNPFYSVMRQIVFRKIFIKNRSPEVLADMLARLSAEEVTGPNILEIIGMIDDTVKHHVLNVEEDNKERYWSRGTWQVLRNNRRDKSQVDVRKIFMPHIDRLRKAASKFELVSSGKTRNIRSIPDRGFVGEMSGYLADVCYTAEYPLLKPRPNMVPHKFVDGEGEEAEFFGSFLTFELEEDTGEKVMLVRGFNVPNEATIDIASFIEEQFNRLEKTAQRRGTTKIVIPGLMGALTNYPLTKRYLLNRYIKGRTPITLKEEFKFNGYDLTENCFVVRTIQQEANVSSRPTTTKLTRPETPPPAMT